ncbi:MAG: hypothetical protein ABS75_33190 [Pelagibacterium sp. SCN 63-23]|nr:MAG: hypothetical protein ABS75_33190 [Pelagibacterium sp. SCN 63-23]
MPSYSSFETLLLTFNWNGAGSNFTYVLPGTSAKTPDIDGVYTFSYSFLNSLGDVDDTGDYDTPSVDLDSDPLTQDEEYEHFRSTTSLQEEAFEIVLHNQGVRPLES